jgi:hypothetical protein
MDGTEAPSAVPKPLRDRGIAPPCAPGPLAFHAASVEALLGDKPAFVTALSVPSTDVKSAAGGSILL